MLVNTFRTCLLISARAATIVAGTFFNNSVWSQPTADAIKTRLSELLAVLPESGQAAHPLWEGEAAQVRARLGSLLYSDNLGKLAAMSEDLVKALKGAGVVSNPAVLEKLDTLSKEVLNLQANDPVTAFFSRTADLLALAQSPGFPNSHLKVREALVGIDKLTSSIEGSNRVSAFAARGQALSRLLEPPPLPSDNPVVLDTATKLLPSLEELELGNSSVALRRRANGLKEALRTYVVGKPLAQNGALLASLSDLATAIDVVFTMAKPRVHIVSARFGDLTRGAPISRTCNARPAMLTRCERATSCSLTSKPEVDLCGYDPAPLASSAIKGLHVSYQCVSGSDDDWAELGTRATVPEVSVRTEILRNALQKLVCYPEAQEPPK